MERIRWKCMPAICWMQEQDDASYQWNTGDTTQSIVIQAEGMYTVEMESPIGLHWFRFGLCETD